MPGATAASSEEQGLVRRLNNASLATPASHCLSCSHITAGTYEFHDDAWAAISPAAKDIVAKMLTVDPARRITLDGVIHHPWIIDASTGSSTHLAQTIKSLAAFNARRKLRAAVRAAAWAGGFAPGARRAALASLVKDTHLSSAALEQLTTAMRAERARTGNATVTLEQLTSLLRALDGDELPAARIFALFDADGSGCVDYNELALGLANISDATSEQSIRMAFKMYDEDDSGYLTRDELARLLATAGHTVQGNAPPAEATGLKQALPGAPASEEEEKDEDASRYVAAIASAIEAMDTNQDGKGKQESYASPLPHSRTSAVVIWQ